MIDEATTMTTEEWNAAYDEGYSDGLEAGYEQAMEAMFETLAQGLDPEAFAKVRELLTEGVT